MDTQAPLRNPDARWDFTGISNVLASNIGVGMMDVDAVFHRLSPNNRFAFIEKKYEGEAITVGEKLTLRGLAKLPGVRAFKLTYMKDGKLELRECKGTRFPVIAVFETEAEFGWWLTSWWHLDDEEDECPE